MSERLTKPQRGVLVDIERFGEHGTHYGDSYPPIQKLVGYGFVERITGKWSDRYRITDAGRAALNHLPTPNMSETE